MGIFSVHILCLFTTVTTLSSQSQVRPDLFWRSYRNQSLSSVQTSSSHYEEAMSVVHFTDRALPGETWIQRLCTLLHAHCSHLFSATQKHKHTPLVQDNTIFFSDTLCCLCRIMWQTSLQHVITTVPPVHKEIVHLVQAGRCLLHTFPLLVVAARLLMPLPLLLARASLPTVRRHQRVLEPAGLPATPLLPLRVLVRLPGRLLSL